MSDLTEKLSAPYGTPGKARATLNQLRLMLGGSHLEVSDDGLIRTGMYGQRERWTLISGKGASSIYERQGES